MLRIRRLQRQPRYYVVVMGLPLAHNHYQKLVQPFKFYESSVQVICFAIFLKYRILSVTSKKLNLEEKKTLKVKYKN